MKMYKVPLYKCKYTKEDKNTISQEINYIDDIIVKRNLFLISEIITGYKGIEIEKISIGEEHKHVFKKKFKDSSLIIFMEDLVESNCVTKKDIEEYVQEYEHSRWKELYEKTNDTKKIYSIKK